MTEQQHQADSVIHEDQLLNFLVNALTGAFGTSIAGNGDIDRGSLTGERITPPETVVEASAGSTR